MRVVLAKSGVFYFLSLIFTITILIYDHNCDEREREIAIDDDNNCDDYNDASSQSGLSQPRVVIFNIQI